MIVPGFAAAAARGFVAKLAATIVLSVLFGVAIGAGLF